MKTATAILLGLFGVAALSTAADDSDAELVKVYCFSNDLEAGFKDIDGNFFCVQLAKRGEKKGSLSRVESRADADMVAEFLTAAEVTKRGETTFVSYGLAWTPETRTNVETAVVSVDGYSKAFSGEGINAAGAMELVKNVEEWVRENRETILEKAAAAK